MQSSDKHDCGLWLAFRRVALQLLVLIVGTFCAIEVTQAEVEDKPPLHQLRFSRLLTGADQDHSRNISAILSIAQDQTGYMWFAGENGLARYDGHEFKIFQTQSDDPASLSTSYIWDLLVDNSGQLWLATLSGLNRYNPNLQNFSVFNTSIRGPGITEGNGLPDDTLFCLALDADNSIWIGGAQGLYRFNPQRDAFEVIEILQGYSVRSLLFEQGSLWVGTAENGLLRLDENEQLSGHWRHDASSPGTLPNNYVRAIERGPEGNLWVGTMGGGLARMLEVEDATFKVYKAREAPGSIAGDSIWDIHTDKHGYLWVASDPGGLARFNPDKDSFEVYNHQEHILSSLSSDKVRVVFDDTLGDLWVGMFPGGINYLDKSTAAFKNYTRESSNQRQLINSSITALEASEDGRVYVGTEGGVSLYDPTTERFEALSGQVWQGNRITAQPILSIEETPQGDVWMGTWGAGLVQLDPGTQQLNEFAPGRPNSTGLVDSYIWSLLSDSQGRLWVGSENSGLFLYDSEQKMFERFSPDPARADSLSFSHVWALLEDKNNNLWVGTINGLNRLLHIDEDGAHFQHYFATTDSNSLSSNRIISLFEDHKGYIWVGTQDAGLNRLDPSNGEVRRFALKDGLPALHISSITQDSDNAIWISTTSGIARLNYSDFSVASFSQSRGLISNNFNRNASAFINSGQLVVGSSMGLTVFSPEAVKNASVSPSIVATDFKLFNRSVTPGDETGLLKKSIENTKAISLSDNQNMFSVDFALLSYRASQLNQYAYQLVGFDRDWNYVNNQRSATYTNLDPGDYELLVKAADASGNWHEPKKLFSVHINPPFYKSYWAYGAVVCFILWLVWLLFSTHRRKLELGHQRTMAEKLMKLDRMKDAFLANTSHELRTPLNGIIGLAESMIEGGAGELNHDMHHNLRMISSSGRRLSNLINDILDYSKLREDKLQIQLKPVNLNMIVDAVFELLEPLIGKKKLELIHTLETPVYILADADRMQQVLLNLVGNAIKFSTKGHVKVYAESIDDFWAISVEDTGAGIANKDRNKIFNAFTQLDGEETRSVGGTGLGLAITKQLVELQGGTIKLSSEPGKGSTFTVCLRAGSGETFTEVEPNMHTEAPLPARLNRIVDTGRDETLSLLKPGASCKDYRVLIVDDDPVNRMVLSGMLRLQEYQIIEAESGMEALNIVESGEKIDLIILDVMMPEMSGYEACMRIRAILPVHVMPILFLTAKNFSDDLVRGFVAGGNDFLTKPVSKHELLSRVSTHLSLLDVNRRLEARVKDSQFKNLASSRELQTLSHIVDTINRELDFNVLLKDVLVDVKELVASDYVAYWRVDSSGKRFCVVAEVGSTSNNKEICVLDAGALDKHLENLYNYGHSIIVLDEFEDKTFEFVAQVFEGCKSSLLMTIYFENKVVGFITVVNFEAEESFDENTIDTLHRVRAHVTSAVVKASLLEKLNLHVTKV